MTREELKAYAGTRFYNLSARMGGMFKTIYCLTEYEVTPVGTCRYRGEVMPCIANKYQYDILRDLTVGVGYHAGRPCAANLTHDFMRAQCPGRVESNAVRILY